MTLATLSEEALVTAAREGDDRAFEELYERYRPRIAAFAQRLTHDADRADDVTQEVFISALRRLRQTDRPIAFRPWIYEIARNACIDEYRRAKRVVEVPIDRDGVDNWLNHLTSGPSPEVAMESKMQMEDLQGAFGGLSERHHRIIVARELEGKSYRQIGQELGMSQVVVESTLFRARRKLSAEFEDLNSGRRCQHVRQIISAGHTRRTRLGVRDRRAVSRHLEHCRPCRREAVAVGFSPFPRPVRSLQKVAAAIFPVPLLRLFRRGGTTVSSAARSIHHSAVSASSSAAGYVESASSMGYAGRMAATAVALVTAAVGGGLIAGVGQAPARSSAPRAVRSTASPAMAAESAVTRGALIGARAQWSHEATRSTADRSSSGASHRSTAPNSARGRTGSAGGNQSASAPALGPAQSGTTSTTGASNRLPTVAGGSGIAGGKAGGGAGAPSLPSLPSGVSAGGAAKITGGLAGAAATALASAGSGAAGRLPVKLPSAPKLP